MIDWDALLNQPAQTLLGTTATLTPNGSPGAVEISVIDRTSGIDVAGLGNIEVKSIRPGAIARMAELTENGITRHDLDGATLEVNGQEWRIQSNQLRPSPAGEAEAEVLMILRKES